MSSGGLSMEEARDLQTFTGRLRCDAPEAYDGKEPPTCMPLCEACLLKWLEVTKVQDESGA
jgi:hypothetical protein